MASSSAFLLNRCGVATIAACLAAAGCDKGDGGATGATGAGGAGKVALVISGDTGPWITPCGCASNQSGGLLRRATYLADLKKSGGAFVYLDAGGAGAGTSDYQKVKFEAVLKGEAAMGLHAHNLGKAEIAMGAEYLKRVAEQTGVPFVSANVKDAAGRPIAPGHRIVNAGGKRLAVIGVASQKFEAAGLSVGEPRQAVLDALTPIRGQYDSAVVLAYVPEDELAALAAGLPEADAVVGGPTGQAMAPKRVGPTLVAAATNKGKFLVRLDLPAEKGAAWEGEVVEMGPGLADEPAQVKLLKAYLGQLKEKDFPASQTGLVEAGAAWPVDYRVAGSESCAKCHEPDQTVWAHSKHQHAFETLWAKDFHVDPTCQQCHTTGYGLPGGFESVGSNAALLKGVGCENCHGPSTAHAKSPKIRTPFAAADQCVRCHDHENSPTFNYATYWSRIVHGKPSPLLEARK